MDLSNHFNALFVLADIFSTVLLNGSSCPLFDHDGYCDLSNPLDVQPIMWVSRQDLLDVLNLLRFFKCYGPAVSRLEEILENDL